jgi:NmrA-like family
MSQVIAITGFTGKLAKLITTALLRHPNVQINGICRSPDKVSPALLSLKNIKIFQASTTDVEAIRNGLRGATTCICCYQGQSDVMIEGQKTLIDACIQEGVSRYIASDWSLDFRGLKLGEHPLKDANKHVQSYLEKKEDEGKIKGVHILNGAFAEAIFSQFLGLFDPPEAKVAYYGTGDELIDITTMQDIAAYTAEVAISPEVEGFVNVRGEARSVKQLARSFEEAYGVTLTVQRLGSLDDLFTKMHLLHQQQPKNVYAWGGLFYQYYTTNGSTLLGKLDNDKFPNVQPSSVETLLKSFSIDTIANSSMAHG